MKTLRVILGDQLSRNISSLAGADQDSDTILLAEVMSEATYVPHHKQKLVLFLSAMRHFAEDLRASGFNVRYTKLDDPENTGSLPSEVDRAVRDTRPDRIVVTEPNEYRVLEDMKTWHQITGIDVDIRTDDRFFCSLDEFASWADGRKSLRMEYFYREMRRKSGYLMDGRNPAGGKWNFDAENRKPIPESLAIPDRRRFAPDAITTEVISLVESMFSGHFGDLDQFGWAVSREDALVALSHFVSDILPQFGNYQDAMKLDQPFLFHSILSPYLNTGLLEPTEVCEAAINAFDDGSAPIAAVEGFIRQILGWREFIRGIYWHTMPEYATTNYFDADRPLPALYWTGETDMACVADAVNSTRKFAYAHHIQRLMITGNFALLAGIEPSQVEEWYLAVYADALEWVELPNTHGMALYADGGVMSSKPYAASGAYINKMSDYCGSCRYSVNKKLGDDACPFNYLYWNFMIINEAKIRSNPRMSFTIRNLDRMPSERKEEIVRQASSFLDSLPA